MNGFARKLMRDMLAESVRKCSPQCRTSLESEWSWQELLVPQRLQFGKAGWTVAHGRDLKGFQHLHIYTML